MTFDIGDLVTVVDELDENPKRGMIISELQLDDYEIRTFYEVKLEDGTTEDVFISQIDGR